MANKRNLKKQVKYLCGDMASECILAIELAHDIDKEKMEDAIGQIAKLQFSTIEHITFSFDKSPRDFTSKKEYRQARNEYFKKAYCSIVKEFNTKVDEILKIMNSALPSNKKAEA